MKTILNEFIDLIYRKNISSNDLSIGFKTIKILEEIRKNYHHE